MALIPATQPDAGWWLEQQTHYRNRWLANPTEDTWRPFAETCRQYQEAVQACRCKPLRLSY